MNRVALLIGGNQGDRQGLIEQATVLIRERIGAVALASRLYETEPWGDFGVESGERRVPDFMNRALLVETALGPHEALHEALAIEAELGRKRRGTPNVGEVGEGRRGIIDSPRIYSSRPMDIDLIFWNDEVIESPDLTIPHPRMHLRRFVLEPLAEIMPDYRHPLLEKSVSQLLAALPE